MRLLNPEEILKNKERILLHLESVERAGMDSLIEYLEGSDYFSCPASGAYHLNIPGGLAQHSINVAEGIEEMLNKYRPDEPEKNWEQSVLVGYLHDLCKVDFYKLEKKWKKINEKWVQVPGWGVKDNFPVGHGEKSVFIASRHIRLDDDEIMAIRWHLGPWEPSVHFPYSCTALPYQEAVKSSILTASTVIADYEATIIKEWVEDLEKYEFSTVEYLTSIK